MNLNEIKLIHVELDKKSTLENLMALYLHDLSEFAPDLKVNEEGKFEYEGLELYFSREDLKPFFIYFRDEIIGFVFLNTGRYVPQDIDFCIHELFILKGFRGSGISTIAMKKLMDSYNGRYSIQQLINNKIALKFWRNFYKRQEIEYSETIEMIDDLECYTQVFNVN